MENKRKAPKNESDLINKDILTKEAPNGNSTKIANHNYVYHFCKNSKCNEGWQDLDLTNAQTRPPRWKYCKKCCEKFGYINPEMPPKRKRSKKQMEIIEKNMFPKRKKSPTTYENDSGV